MVQGLEVGVGQTVLREFVFSPFVGLLELRRTRQALANVVRKIFEIFHYLTVLADFAENLRIRKRKGAFLIRRRPCRARSHSDQGHRASEHKDSNPT